MTSAEYSLRGDIAVISLANPPMNTLAHPMRVAMHELLQKAAADSAVKAIVLTGSGRAFCAGAEIREFNTPAANDFPNSRDLVAAFENCAKPVVAAMHGAAMGGGLELTLACHYRVAAPGAQLALPEVKLGLIPGAGGTQRLPRALGVARSLDMIINAKTMSSESVAGTLLVDEIIQGDLVGGAVAFARRLPAGDAALRKLRDITPSIENAEAFFSEQRQRAAKSWRGYPAPAKCIDAIEASLRMPVDEGMRFERSLFDQLLEGSESKALRHAFFGERTVAKIPGIGEDAGTRDVNSVAILGAGTMGGGIAMAFADAGISVQILDAKAEALERGLNAIRANYTGAVTRGRLKQTDMDARMSRIRGTLNMNEIRDADLVIEAVFEDMAVKRDVFTRLDATMKPGAILASNTSSLDLDEIAAVTKRPQDVVGAHFFSPANVMRLLEVIRGAKSSPETLASVMKLARKLGKVAVVSGVCDGFIGNRMMDFYLRQAEYLLDEGAAPEQVDRALTDWGMAMGPFAMCDMSGNDIIFHIRTRRRAAMSGLPYSCIGDRLFELKRFGQKTGSGYYRYKTGSRAPIADEDTAKLIDECRIAASIKPREIGDKEIIERCIYALVNEGARILEEGIAARAVDIDMVYLSGYGFPAYRGGPMFYADTVGLSNILKSMEVFAKGYRGESWMAAPLLSRLARESTTFN
ncbi:MAG: 3-hydroxyacyl-CoA dehydrogenase [Betaproteobacteria bacterium]|nr:3-hydroxyacyl-CoA dehydrogenase [Betaproteobacteria bacterium]